MSEEDIWIDLDSPFSDIHKMRDMKKIIQPKFKTPRYVRKFTHGNQECQCVCETKYLPRNALLIRPKNIKTAEPIYELMEKAWRLGRFRYLSVGSCQQCLRKFEITQDFRILLEHASISCIDNIDNSKLKPGDIVLTRHGKELIGKPHLIEG